MCFVRCQLCVCDLIIIIIIIIDQHRSVSVHVRILWSGSIHFRHLNWNQNFFVANNFSLWFLRKISFHFFHCSIFGWSLFFSLFSKIFAFLLQKTWPIYINSVAKKKIVTENTEKKNNEIIIIIITNYYIYHHHIDFSDIRYVKKKFLFCLCKISKTFSCLIKSNLRRWKSS